MRAGEGAAGAGMHERGGRGKVGRGVRTHG